MGPRDRRDGRDHPGDARRMRGAWRRHRDRCRSRPAPGGERQGGGRRPRRWPRTARGDHRQQPQPEIAVHEAGRAQPAGRRHRDPHRGLPLRLRHLPHERGAVGAAGFHRDARHPAAAAPPQRDPDRAVAAVFRAGLFRCQVACTQPRLGAPADCRGGDFLDARRHPGARRPACGQPVLPAGESRDRRRGRRLGRAPRHGCQADDRYRRCVCAQLRAQRAGLRGIESAGPGAPHRPGRRRHLPRRTRAGPDVQRAPAAGAGQLSRRVQAAVPVRVRHPPGRWRHRPARPQCRTRNPQGPGQGAAARQPPSDGAGGGLGRGARRGFSRRAANASPAHHR